MPLVTRDDARTFTLDGLTVVGLAAPSRGSRELSAWRATLAPGTPGAPHTVDREEVFVAIAGTAHVTLDGVEHVLREGEALVVPPGTELRLANPADEPFEAVVAFPVGGRASLPGGEPFVPPWAA
jgi:quercetin dioxygenase-like cupin family protein